MDGHRFNPRLGTVLGGRLGTVLGGAPTGTQAQPKRPRWATDGMTTACRGVASGAPDGHFARGTPPKVAGGSKKMDGHGFNPRLGTVLGGGLVTVLGGAPTGTRARPKQPRGATDGMTTVCRGVASGSPDRHLARGTSPKVAGGSKKVDGHGFNPRLGTVLGGALASVRARPKRPRGATDGMTTVCRGVASGAPDGHLARGASPKVAGESKKMDVHGFNLRLGTVLGGAPASMRARPKPPRGATDGMAAVCRRVASGAPGGHLARGASTKVAGESKKMDGQGFAA